MCTKEEVQEALEENNKKRDKNLDNKLLKLRDDVFAHTSKLMEHTSPETKELINNFETNCLLNRGQFSETNIKMQNDIGNILKAIKEDKIWKRDFEKRVETNYAKKHEVVSLQTEVHKNTLEVEKQKKFMWQITTAVSVLIFLWQVFGKAILEDLNK